MKFTIDIILCEHGGLLRYNYESIKSVSYKINIETQTWKHVNVTIKLYTLCTVIYNSYHIKYKETCLDNQ